jgi:hypothetical protein
VTAPADCGDVKSHKEARMSHSRPYRPDNIILRRERHRGCVDLMPGTGDRVGADAASEGGSSVGRALVLERAAREHFDVPPGIR